MNNESVNKEQKKLSVREFLSLGEVGGYFFRGKDPSRPRNFNIRMMHGINKLSIIMFLIAVVVIVVRRFL
ncbi:MAG: DUF6728 family protein [Cyclobacteriaceae bacterium]|jgi:hypothetical protein